MLRMRVSFYSVKFLGGCALTGVVTQEDGLLTKIITTATEISNKIVGPITGALSTIAENLSGPLDTAFATVSGIIDQVKGPIADAIAAVSNLLTKLAPIFQMLSPIIEIAGLVISTAFSGVAKVITDIANGISTVIDMFVDWRDRADELVSREENRRQEESARERFKLQTGVEWSENIYGSSARAYELGNGQFDVRKAAAENDIRNAYLAEIERNFGYDKEWYAANYGMKEDWTGRAIEGTWEAKSDEAKTWQQRYNDILNGSFIIDEATKERLKQNANWMFDSPSFMQNGKFSDSDTAAMQYINKLNAKDGTFEDFPVLSLSAVEKTNAAYEINANEVAAATNAAIDFDTALQNTGTTQTALDNSVKDVTDAVRECTDELSKIPGFSIGINSLDQMNADIDTPIGHKASGTANFAGGWTHINEEGGELAFLPQGTAIVPADKTDRILEDGDEGGGYNTTINITVQGSVDDNVLTRLRDELKAMMADVYKDMQSKSTSRSALVHGYGVV
ncbi:hypothetical protein FACS1894184_18960 [Clostridia bacterium]|nr:hypothetical protein FACS1894184_18960 [Clostridia bacterium]